MTNLFSWLLRRFLVAFAVLFAVQLAVYVIGLNTILKTYEKNKVAEYEKIAEDILQNPQSVNPADIPSEGPFFVFSADREMIFSNKGKGKSLSNEDLMPVYRGDALIGYFHAGEMNFTDNQANRIFLASLIVLSGISVIVSIGIGFIAALLSAKRIVRPVNLIRSDIHRVRTLKPVPGRNFRIRELAEISNDVAEASETLMGQEKYKQQWLRDLSHDLRTPLAGLKSQLEAMSDGVLEATPERFRRHLAEIDRLEGLAASIGELTAIEAQAELEKQPVGIEGLFSQIAAPFEYEIKRKNIDLKIEVLTDVLPGDQRLLIRGIGNIFSNAVKFVDENGFILMKAERSGDEIRVEISNNGPDIPEEQRELVFTRLFRGDAGRTAPGSGLGLSISREIINLHGGEIRVEQQTPRGVRFVMGFPV